MYSLSMKSIIYGVAWRWSYILYNIFINLVELGQGQNYDGVKNIKNNTKTDSTRPRAKLRLNKRDQYQDQDCYSLSLGLVFLITRSKTGILHVNYWYHKS